MEREEKVLALGLNFAVASNQIPYQEIITATEETARRVDANTAQLLRKGVGEELRKARPPENNINKHMQRAISSLWKDDNIMILRADKGKATVVLDKAEYTRKIQEMLDDPTYKAVRKDPTIKVEKRIADTLTRLERDGSIMKELRRRLTPQFSSSPQLYGLPKVHKENIPLRPIVSTIGWPTYDLAKELARILSPLARSSETSITNTGEFIERLKVDIISGGDMMVSFDVVSLFTRVPLKEAMEVIFARFEQDETLEERTNIPVHDICHLTEEICLTSTYFQFQDAFYEQVDGAAMGSPLLPIVANIYMESMETRALETFHAKPKFWVHYVDDTFVLWQHGEEKLETFHKHLNSQHSSIQFTKEVECDNKIPFLDVLIERTETGITTRVYRKKTHTDQYIHYTSHHHPRAKLGSIKCLKYRMDKVCNADSKQEELNNIRKAFRNNGYPDKFITRALQNPTQPRLQTKKTQKDRRSCLSRTATDCQNGSKVCVVASVLKRSLSHTTHYRRS